MKRQWPIVILIAATLLAMGRLATDEFVEWDDPATIALNPAFRPPTLASLEQCWTSTAGHLYVPLTYTAWWLLATISRLDQPDVLGSLLNAWLFHSASILVHLTTSIIVFQMLRKLTCADMPALLGALVFALHPVQVETIAWASGFKDLLCTMFIAVSILLLVRFRSNDEQIDKRSSFSGTACGVLALTTLLACLCKPTAIMTPVLLAIIDRQRFQARFRKTAKELSPAIAIAAAFAIIGMIAQPPISSDFAPIYLRPIIATDALAFYIYKLILPLNLAIDYGRTPEATLASGSIWWTWIALLVPLLVLRRRLGKGLREMTKLRVLNSNEGKPTSDLPPSTERSGEQLCSTGLIVAVMSLLPILGFVPFTFQAFSTVADHYLYPAMIGVAFVVAGAAMRIERRSTGIAAACILTLGLGTLSFKQAGDWKDGFALFAHTLEVNPRSAMAHTNLAAEFQARGDVASAETQFADAVAIDSNDAFAHLGLAKIATAKGDSQSAKAQLREVLRIYSMQRNADPALAAQLRQMGQP